MQRRYINFRPIGQARCLPGRPKVLIGLQQRRRVASSLARRLARHLLLTLCADGSLPLWPVVWPVIF